MTVNSLTKYYQIKGKFDLDGTSLVMKVPETGHVTTQTLPLTEEVLGKYLPTIFGCQCFNDANKNFREESKNTELGHLFEHIMLEYLCMEKLKDNEDASYEGKTSWNWEKDPKGTFYIEIMTGMEDVELIKKAFNKSIGLLKRILTD